MDYRNPRGPIYAAVVNLRTTSLPHSLSLPHDIVELCEEKIAAPYNFHTEHKVLEQHETLKRKPSFMTMLDESAAAAGVGSPTDSDGFLTASILSPTAMPMAMAKEVSPPSRPAPLTSQTSFNMAEFDAKQRKIQEMAKATGATEDVCGFFLESMNWNVDEAMTMYFSTRS